MTTVDVEVVVAAMAVVIALVVKAAAVLKQ